MAGGAATLEWPPTAANGVLLLPERPRRFGPMSGRLVRRFVLALATVEVVGTVLAAVGGPGSATRAAGLSLVFPGGGLLYLALPVLFAVVLALVVLGVVLWWGLSAHWAVPLVWLASAVLSAALADGPRLLVNEGTTWPWAVPVVYLAAVAAVATAVVRFERRFRAKRGRVPELNAYLADVDTTRRPREADEAAQGPGDMDAELLRWTYQLALQPLDRFEGFDWGEQIHGPTCVRYQLNMLGYALAAYTANWLPNAPATAEPALAALIERATDLRVWGYWRTLNLIGNLSADPDPIRRDNIMLSAYLCDQINLYEAATGSTRFDEPGSLTFVWKDGRTYPYCHHTIAEAVERNFAANDLGFFPCEPGWVFTACNTMGAQALKGHDTLHGTGLWTATEPRWRHAVEHEMLTPDGNLPHIRSKLIGVSFDTGEVPGGEYFLTGTNGFADVAPDLAARGGLLTLRGVADRMAALRGLIVDGELQHTVAPAPERNTLITTAVPGWTRLVGGARAVGAHDVARAALRRMDRECGTGERWPGRPLHAGVQSIGIHLLVRWGAPMNTAALDLRGWRPPEGPVLADAGPNVLVTRAQSPDGRSLELALRPLDPSASVVVGSAVLRITAAQPDTAYTVTVAVTGPGPGGGSWVVRSGADGEMAVTVDVDGPIVVRLEPEEATAP